MKRKVIIRMDDICPMMKREPFERMVNLLLKYNATAIIGVVPDCKDSSLNLENEDIDFWNTIKELQNKGWTIAMHGCFHNYVTTSNGLISNNKRSEFAGLSYDEQYKKLKHGKDMLEQHGVKTNVFMAPSHSYDKNTLKALNKLEFKYITDGLTSVPYEYCGLVFIPCRDSKIRSRNGLMTVCYHTNTIHEERYRETEDLLINHREDLISFNEACNFKTKSYFFSRIEEKLFWFWKYIFVSSVYSIAKVLGVRK